MSNDVNPYAAPDPDRNYMPAQPAYPGAIVPTAVEAGSVINYAWEIWKANLGLLVGVTAIVFGANLVLYIAQMVVAAISQRTGLGVVGALAGAGLTFANMFLQIYLGIGQVQIALKLLRRQPAAIGDLFAVHPHFLRVLGGSILFGLAMWVGFMLCFIPGILLALFYWPFYWLLVDSKGDLRACLDMTYPVGKANVGPTLILWLASMGIMLLGLLALGVGILFAAPLVSLMWGSAYLMMTGQIPQQPNY